MNKKQLYTPKYWVIHNPDTNDVFIDTMDKSLKGAEEKFFLYYPHRKFDFYSGFYVANIVELRLINHMEDTMEDTND